MKQYTIVIQHDDYEHIKKPFALLRRQRGLKYVHGYTDDKGIMRHSWETKDEKIHIEYYPVEVQKEETKTSFSEAWIQYTSNDSTTLFIELLNIS